MSQLCLWDDVAYGIYDISLCVASSPEYGCDVYYNAIENVLSNTMSFEDTIFCELVT